MVKNAIPTQQKTSIKTDSPLDAALRRGEEAKAKLLSKEGGVLTGEDACATLGCNLSELEAMRNNHQVLGLSVNDNFVYPAWQFVDGKVLAGLDRVLSELKDDGVWTEMIFLLTGDIRLDGATPLEKLREGEIDRVVWAASCYGGHSATPIKRLLKRGSAKGKIEIRNDFDEPLEDFQEYME